MTGLGLTEAEKQDFEKRLATEKEHYQCHQCEVWKDSLLKNSPIVRFMVDELRKINRPVTKDDFKCLPCDTTRAGGFSPVDGILLCQNYLTKSIQERTMAHEMIHMYDHYKFKVDWSNLKHQACSEQHQACVKRRAVLSVMQNPNCKSKEEAERAVSTVFDSCFADTRPFDEIY
ncbi:peptidase M76 [Mycotypha africana]|uniref:peptidase M76 n=1 Tax=Mycotypha africana TaxID=64632 RepID=UPI0023013798|nr:peptidase M76 [Mycotypha africana]KAI8969231.1 peptidase M76 [Mycotypha africana]